MTSKTIKLQEPAPHDNTRKKAGTEQRNSFEGETLNIHCRNRLPKPARIFFVLLIAAAAYKLFRCSCVWLMSLVPATKYSHCRRKALFPFDVFLASAISAVWLDLLHSTSLPTYVSGLACRSSSNACLLAGAGLCASSLVSITRCRLGARNKDPELVPLQLPRPRHNKSTSKHSQCL